mgnify:CR=1 FL=1
MIGLGLCLFVGAILSYWIPTLAVLLQQTTYRVVWKSRLLIVGLFVFFTILAWVQWKTSLKFYLFIPLLLILLFIAITDYWFGLIPNRITYPTILILSFIRWWTEPKLFFHYFCSMLMSGIGVFLLAVLTKGIGIGDAKLVGLGGLVVGLPEILFAFWFATISGMLYIIWRWIIGKKIGRKTPFPFGPHLALGIVILYLYDGVILRINLLLL